MLPVEFICLKVYVADKVFHGPVRRDYYGPFISESANVGTLDAAKRLGILKKLPAEDPFGKAGIKGFVKQHERPASLG